DEQRARRVGDEFAAEVGADPLRALLDADAPARRCRGCLCAAQGRSSSRYEFAERVAAAAVLPLFGRSAAALAMLAAVLHEPEHVEPAVELERVQRDLRRQEVALLGTAGELDRGGAPVAEQALQQLGELGKLGGMDARDRRREQLVPCVPEESAAGVVRGQDAV